jgi:uncharacterized protein (TIGR03790 family)
MRGAWNKNYATLLDGTRTTRHKAKMTKFVSITLLLLLLTRATVFAGGDEVILIYNTRVPESKAVADYYAQRRSVPTNQIFGFSVSKGLDMTRAEFRDALQKPLAHELEARNLWHIRSQTVPATNGHPAHVEKRVMQSSIRYAVICYGVPIRILKDDQLKETVADNVRPEFRRNEACVDNELACLPLIEQNLPLAGPLLNPHYATTNEAALNPLNGILLVTRLDGPTPAIARGLVDKAIEAENEGMWGRAYFDLRGTSDPNMKLGDDWIGGAAEICRHLGFETQVDTNAATFPASFPMSQISFYCGWYDENVSGPFTLPKVEFMPGAFAYHLHSYSASDIRSPTNRWVGPFLARGVTITMGSVDEPYLSGTPNVAVFASRLIFSRFNFAEAAYVSQTWLSWQTIVIGDPLYRPFGKPPPQLHQELENKHSKLLEWSHLRVVNLNLAIGTPVAQLVNFLEQIPTTKQSAVLMEKFGDLLTAQGKPSSALDAYRRALALDPSPQQRIRLRLTLGEKLLAANRDAEAEDNYQKLLEESPDYPGKASLLEKLAALKQKPGNSSGATNAPVKP